MVVKVTQMICHETIKVPEVCPVAVRSLTPGLNHDALATITLSKQ